MHCANPDCETPAVDLSTGVLRLIELDVSPEQRVIRSDGGFPVCSVPCRYFWLCPRCSSFLGIMRWTPDGLTFERRTNAGTRTGATDRMPSFAHHYSRNPVSSVRKTA